jgi:2-iminobutanoate/2-iminopropanoate deaminase
VSERRVLQFLPASSAAPIPEGIRVDDMIYASALTGMDPQTGKLADGLLPQMEQALRNLQALVERAGGSLDNVGRVTGFVSRVVDRDPIYEPWDALFPNPTDRPAFKVLNTPLPDGVLVQLSGQALLGERRQRIDIDGVSARDPTVKLGNLLFSSRLHGTDPATGTHPDSADDQAEHAYGNVRRLVELAGGDLSNVTQITAFVHDQAGARLAEDYFTRTFPDPSTRPAFWAIEAFIRPQLHLMVELVAVL